MIVWVASYPRSGNTYWRVLLHHFYGVIPYNIYTDAQKRGKQTLQPLWQEDYDKIIDHPTLSDMQRTAQAYFVKTHELPGDDSPAVYLVRDGRDALVSYAHFIRDFESPGAPFEPTLHALIVNPGYFGGWSNHVMQWTNRKAPTAIVKFEELVTSQNPLVLLEKALRQIGCACSLNLSAGEAPTFAELRAKVPKFFRQGQIGGFQKEMAPPLHELFWQKHGHAMKAMGYTPES